MTRHPAPPEPGAIFADQQAEARWKDRFTAARISLPDWAHDAPDRGIYVSNASGVWEVYAWDRATDSHRQVTKRPNGTSNAAISPDGSTIWWFNDTDGDEFGSWVTEPFHGRRPEDEPQSALIGVHDGYPAGLAIGSQISVVGTSTDHGTTIWISQDGNPAEVIYTSTNDGGVGALSEDERLLAIVHSEHGDNRHPALRVLATDTGATVAEKWDGPGKGLDAIEFCPVKGDSRLLVLHERHGKDELLIWDIEKDSETEITLDLPGEVTAGWYRDGSALLIAHTYQARTSLHRYDLTSETLSTVDTPRGFVGAANARIDGSIEYTWSSSACPPVIRTLAADGADYVLLEPAGHKAAPSVNVKDAFVASPNGTIHALIAKPDKTTSPLPVIFSVHGGPHAMDEDRFSAYRAAWVDAGFAVVHVNYRGSTGYGSAWRDAIEGRPGLTELADIAAVQDWAVQTGLADPLRCVINGASWGGYLTLLGLGVQPERWAAGVAGVPVADYLAAYEDEMEQLRAFDRALFGGSPDEKPELYRECSPITYVDQVKAPVLVIAGENDPRCPIRQINNYLDELAKRDVSYEVYRYDAGHGSLVIAETIKQTAIELDFVRRMLGLEI